ncbi:MAG: IS66 family transposase [Alphaproteobacteria bacterium]|nr:IS66 family transposase [Alphaproteobacteria bacterium]
MLSAAETLSDDPAILKDMVVAQSAEIHNQNILIEKLKAQLSGMQRHRFGQSSEKLDQLEMTLENAEIAALPIEPAKEQPALEEKQKPVRKALPEHLERIDDILPVPEESCKECGGHLRPLSESITEELDYIPARFVVRRIIRPKRSCRACETIHQAPMPTRPIERGRPTAGLLAHVLVSKYCDHLPLYRQSQIYAREGIDLSRSTLAGWVAQSAQLLEPLAESIGKHVMAGDAIFADDTTTQVQAPGQGKTRTGRIWAYVRDERGYNGNAAPAAYYKYSPDRKGAHPQEHLKGFSGFMHVDGYTGYNAAVEDNNITEVACLAHIRRKFFDVHQANGSTLALEALEHIAKLYQIEKQIKGQPPDIRRQVRQEQAEPLLQKFEDWLHQTHKAISGKTPLAAAIRYALSRLPKLKTYLDDGRLEIDNNAAERAMRPIALGRKNYMFMGSDGGGKAAAILYTLIETAKMNGINPQDWLTDVLTRIPDHSINKVDELMPWNYVSHKIQSSSSISEGILTKNYA